MVSDTGVGLTSPALSERPDTRSFLMGAACGKDDLNVLPGEIKGNYEAFEFLNEMGRILVKRIKFCFYLRQIRHWKGKVDPNGPRIPICYLTVEHYIL